MSQQYKNPNVNERAVNSEIPFRTYRELGIETMKEKINMNNDIPPEPGENIIDVCSYGKKAFLQNFKKQDGEKFPWFVFDSEDKPVIIFPLTKNNEVIAIEIFRYGAIDWVWEIPGGSVGKYPNWNNIPEKVKIEKTKQELEEETGYIANEIIQISSPIWFDPASVRVAYTPMLALNCVNEGVRKPEPEEIIREIKEIPLKRWIEMIKTHEICDSKTIAITMMVLCHLNYDLIPD
jgi:hypothetical protein